jgi:hypothetical protein
MYTYVKVKVVPVHAMKAYTRSIGSKPAAISPVKPHYQMNSGMNKISLLIIYNERKSQSPSCMGRRINVQSEKKIV